MRDASGLAIAVGMLALILGLAGVVMPVSEGESGTRFYYAVGTTDEQTDSGNWEDIPDMSLTISVNEGETIHLIFTGVFLIYGTFATTQGTFQILRNGTTICGMGITIRALNNPYSMGHNVAGNFAEDPDAGTYNYKVQWKSVSNYYIKNLVASSPTTYHRCLTIQIF